MTSPTDAPDAHAAARAAMVEHQLRRRGIADGAVLAAMGRVPRHCFTQERDPRMAYGDHPLPIGYGQTISQPYMVARMVELLRLGAADRVLEVGAGSGYQTAILAQLCAHVWATEIVCELADRGRRALEALDVLNVTVACRDGTLGWPEHAPFDGIVVAAGAPALPEPLREQLAEGGRLVIPVGDRMMQILRLYVRRGEELVREDDTACRFVDLQGEHGWPPERW